MANLKSWIANEKQATLLVVDDTPENLAILGDLLQPTYRVRAANSGQNALESVSKHYLGLQSFLSIHRIEARRRKARALRLRFSQSLASRRQRLSQAKLRSAIQRLGRTVKVFVPVGRLTMTTLRLPRRAATP